MSENRDQTPGGSPDLSESFEARLQKALRRGKSPSRGGLNETSAMGIAMRLVTELVAGLVVGAGIGWFLDRWLDSSPWLLIVFFVLGAIAGINNVLRAARQMNAARETGDIPNSAGEPAPDRGSDPAASIMNSAGPGPAEQVDRDKGDHRGR